MTKLRTLTALATATVITLATAGAASAGPGLHGDGALAKQGSAAARSAETMNTTASYPHKLHVDVYTCDFATTGECATATDGAFGRWVTFSANGKDSPLDSNSKALVVHTPGPNLDAYDYVEVYSNASLNLNKPVAQVKNLSFDALKSSLRGGSPRIDVFFADTLGDGGTYIAIDAGNCQQAISSTWVRADATGRKTVGCTIYTDAGTAYSSDGTHSAWANFVAANPDAVVAYTFMVFDIPTGTDSLGDYRVDRIALGTGKYYNASLWSVNCYYEGSC